MGQINIVILFFLALFFYFLSKKNNKRAGMLLAFPLMIKFFPLFFVPYFFISRNWKLLSAALVTIGIIIWITVLFCPLPAIQVYFQNILPDLLSSWKGQYYNQSLTGFLMRTFQDTTLRQTLRFFLSFLLVASSFFVIIKNKKTTGDTVNLKLSLLITLTLLINSFSWQHHFIWLLIPFFVSFFYVMKNRLSRKYFLFLFAAYLLIAVNIKNPSSMPVIFQSHVFYGALLLYLVNLYILLKRK